MVGLGSGLGGRAHFGPCLVRRAPSARRLPCSTLCSTYSGEDLGIGIGLGLGLGSGRGLGLECVLELGLVGPVVVHGGADSFENHTHLVRIRVVWYEREWPGKTFALAGYTVYLQGVHAGCACRVHAWHIQGVYAAHAPRQIPALLPTHGLSRKRASSPPPYRAAGVMVRGRGRIRVGLLNLSRVERRMLGLG